MQNFPLKNYGHGGFKISYERLLQLILVLKNGDGFRLFGVSKNQEVKHVLLIL